MDLNEALAIVKAAGYKVSKPGLNAVGKPYSSSYDPNYRMGYKSLRQIARRPHGEFLRTHLTGDFWPR